jgi:hypothetical protein
MFLVESGNQEYYDPVEGFLECIKRTHIFIVRIFWLSEAISPQDLKNKLPFRSDPNEESEK